MTVVLILVILAPEDRPYKATAFDGSKRQVHLSHHGSVMIMRE